MKDAKKYLGFDDKWLVLIGIPFVSVIVLLQIFGIEGFTCGSRNCLIISFIFSTCYWLVFRWVIINYHKSFPGSDFTYKRVGYVLGRLLIAYLAVKFGVGLLLHFIVPSIVEFYDNNKLNPLAAEISELQLIALFFFVYEGIYFLNKTQQMEIERNKLQKLTAEHRLETLKNQVNPHFLFNSLNTLVTMIPEEPGQAVEFVQKLSKTYRNILDVRDEKLILLRQELKALDAYVYLLKTRFQDRIQINNKLEQNLMDKFILPLSLQILIENAVKHNITSQRNPLYITIYEEEGYVVVENNLQKKDQQYASTKMGLANIRSRYELLIHKDISVKETEDKFIVKLPLIENDTE